ncbi:SAM-dependent methyltransferase [Pseudonocardia sp. DLS-67]
MQFVHDDDEAAGLLADYRSRLAPGSVHALSHVTGDHDTTELAAAEAGLLRSREQVAALLDGLELVEPGIVDVTEWRPEDMVGSQHRGMWAAIGRIR